MPRIHRKDRTDPCPASPPPPQTPRRPTPPPAASHTTSPPRQSNSPQTSHKNPAPPPAHPPALPPPPPPATLRTPQSQTPPCTHPPASPYSTKDSPARRAFFPNRIMLWHDNGIPPLSRYFSNSSSRAPGRIRPITARTDRDVRTAAYSKHAICSASIPATRSPFAGIRQQPRRIHHIPRPPPTPAADPPSNSAHRSRTSSPPSACCHTSSTPPPHLVPPPPCIPNPANISRNDRDFPRGCPIKLNS